jgi:diguanylate cyclase (GGDEF)-like protein
LQFDGLDVSTLIVVNASVALFFALIFWLYCVISKTYYGFNYWLGGAFLSAFSLTIALSSSYIPTWSIVFLFHSIYMLAMMMRLDGTIRFVSGKKLPLAFYSIPLILGLAVEVNFLYASNQSLRYVMHSMAFLAITYATAWYLFRYAQKGEKALYYLAGTFMIVRGSFKLFRALHWYFNPDLPLFNADVIHGITMLVEILSEIVIAVTFIMMNGKRTEKSLISAEKQAQASLLEVERLANHDHLTGLASLRLVRDRLGQAIKKARRNKSRVVIMFMDLDGFKPVNDQFGHDVGDRVLMEIAKRFMSSVREADTIGRIGGDEFVYILERFDDRKDMEQFGEKIIREIERPIFAEGMELSVGISIGIALYPDNGLEESELLKSADFAMYRAKESGKVKIVFAGDVLPAESMP